MKKHASGTFEVKLTPQPHTDGVGDPSVGRLALDKRFAGDLQALSQGQMLSLRSDVAGSAGYVAIERVVGKLGERSGSFALQHSGTMTRGAPQLSISVVPDSGSAELTGLSGTMTIQIRDGQHFYDFEYSFAES